MSNSKSTVESLSPTESVRQIAPFLREDLFKALQVVIPQSIRRNEAYIKPEFSGFPTIDDNWCMKVITKLRERGFYVICSEKPYWDKLEGSSSNLCFWFKPPANIMDPAKRKAATVHGLRDPSPDYRHSRQTLYRYMKQEIETYVNAIEPSMRVISLGESRMFLSKARTHPNYTETTRNEGLEPVDAVNCWRCSITRPDVDLQIFFQLTAREYERGFYQWASDGVSRIVTNLGHILPHSYRTLLLEEYRKDPNVGQAFRQVPEPAGAMSSAELLAYFKESERSAPPFLDEKVARRLRQNRADGHRRRRRRLHSRSRSRSPLRPTSSSEDSSKGKSKGRIESDRIKSVVVIPRKNSESKSTLPNDSRSNETREEPDKAVSSKESNGSLTEAIREKIVRDHGINSESEDSDSISDPYIIPRKGQTESQAEKVQDIPLPDYIPEQIQQSSSDRESVSLSSEKEVTIEERIIAKSSRNTAVSEEPNDSEKISDNVPSPSPNPSEELVDRPNTIKSYYTTPRTPKPPKQPAPKPTHPVTTENDNIENPIASTSLAHPGIDALDYELEDPSSEDEWPHEEAETLSRPESGVECPSDIETDESPEQMEAYQKEFAVFWKDRKAYIERLLKNYEAKLE